jgi:hypothetical protein
MNFELKVVKGGQYQAQIRSTSFSETGQPTNLFVSSLLGEDEDVAKQRFEALQSFCKGKSLCREISRNKPSGAGWREVVNPETNESMGYWMRDIISANGTGVVDVTERYPVTTPSQEVVAEDVVA